jgi:adenine-specific DNA-methyltransferase
MKRTIMASSNPGDMVLDAFGRSGTTLAVSEELGRKWIGIDNSPLSIDNIIQRLVNGSEAMGDFVSGKSGNNQYRQINLIEINIVLRTGLYFYIEDSQILYNFFSNHREWE